MRLSHLLTVTVILLGVFALPATADEPAPMVEVCRDDQLITIPADQILESDGRVWSDFDREDCQPPRTPTPTTVPEVVISFPPFTVGYACPGTDGVVVELPWGTYEDMWPTYELAALYGCPVAQPVADSPAVAPVAVAPTTVAVEAPVVETLPFTGPTNTAGLVLAGLALLGLGGLLVRRSEG